MGVLTSPMAVKRTPLAEPEALLAWDSPEYSLRIPLDLLDDIFDLLPRDSLASCARVNTLWYERALPKLYKHIFLRGMDYRWPVFHRIDPPARLARLCPHPASHVELIDLYLHSRALCAPLDLQAIAGQHCIYPASSDSGLGLAGTPTIPPTRQLVYPAPPIPDLPRLRTLRVHLDHGRASYIHPIDTTTICPLFKSMQPQNLVVRNAPLLFEAPPQTLAAIEGVEHAVFVLRPDVALVGTNMKWEANGAGAIGIALALPEDVDHLTIIFHSGQESRWRPQPRPKDIRFPPLLETEQMYIENTWLGRLLFHNDGLLRCLKYKVPNLDTLTFVNMESVDPVAVIDGTRGETIRSSREQVRKTLNEAFTLYTPEFEGWEFDETLKKSRSRAASTTGREHQSRIRSVGMREWLEQTDWAGVFDAEEVLQDWFQEPGTAMS